MILLIKSRLLPIDVHGFFNFYVKLCDGFIVRWANIIFLPELFT